MSSCASQARRSLLAASLAATLSACAAEAPKPNIVLIYVDDMGLDAHCYGNPVVKTPNLDRLAREGVLFERAYTASPSCSASRASLLTGRHPHSHGVISLISGPSSPARVERIRKHSLKRSLASIPRTLESLGYETAIAGKWHVSLDSPAWHGFDRQIRWDDFDSLARTERPFFLYFAPVDTHRPFARDPRFPYDPEDVILPRYFRESGELRRDLAAYYTAITSQDAKVGRILDWLDGTGRSEDTIVIFASDNGPPYPKAKATLYEWGVRSPLIIRYPRTIPAGKRVSMLTSMVDVFPTLLDLLDQPFPDGLEGMSLVPVMNGREKREREALFCETNFHDSFNPARSVRTERWKYIQNLSPGTPLFVVKAELALALLERPLPQPPRPREELYDLQNDPQEWDNLAGDPDYAGVLAAMRALMANWMLETGDDPLVGREDAEAERN